MPRRSAMTPDEPGKTGVRMLTHRSSSIYDIIVECRLAVHDLSRTELDSSSDLPRFNMPLELGIFLGARRFGRGRQKSKRCLVLDRARYRYQVYLSDMSGQDIRAHDNDPVKAVRAVRNWLSQFAPDNEMLPGGATIARRFKRFLADLPTMLQEVDTSSEVPATRMSLAISFESHS